MSETEAQIERLRKRMDGWGLNDDQAWLKVKLGELRAMFRVYDDSEFIRGRAAQRKDELLTIKFGPEKSTTTI